MNYGCKCGRDCRCNAPRAVGQEAPKLSPIPALFIVGIALIAASLLGGEQERSYRP